MCYFKTAKFSEVGWEVQMEVGVLCGIEILDTVRYFTTRQGVEKITSHRRLQDNLFI